MGEVRLGVVGFCFFYHLCCTSLFVFLFFIFCFFSFLRVFFPPGILCGRLSIVCTWIQEEN